MATQALSLDVLERELKYAIDNDAAMIYWHHNMGAFMYFLVSDRDRYREEMMNVRNNIRDGLIITISAGDPITLNSTNLYPMELKIRDAPCYAYMLVRREGEMSDAEKTPYFFKSEKKRDDVIKYLTNAMPSNQSEER